MLLFLPYFLQQFTLHFATINTKGNTFTPPIPGNLHYILLLLIHTEIHSESAGYRKFTLHFATINTVSSLTQFTAKFSFTLHFATINTVCLIYLTT